MKPTAMTGNLANAYEHAEDNYLEFFSKAGSLFEKRQTYYATNTTALDLFKSAWRSGDKVLCMQMLMYLRDIRGGQGNRSGFRSIIKWLAEHESEWVIANIDMIPQIGRWDDLKVLYGTECQKAALGLWSKGLRNPKTSGLAAKWADRKDNIFRKFLNLSPKSYRKLLVSKTKVVENDMCKNHWDRIDYNKVPSVASTRYVRAFSRHDELRYNKWRASLADSKSKNKVNVGAIYPHDIIRQIRANHNSSKVAELNAMSERQLKDMKNYIPKNQRIMPICDFSGSMMCSISGSITPFDVSLALGLYCSEKVGKDNPFYRRLIPFSSNSRLVSWENMNLVEAVKRIPNGYIGSTNIQSAFTSILEAAEFFKATKDQMPTMLLILSDMQFDRGGVSDTTPVEESLELWESMGYDRPQIVYWNMNAYDNQPATCKDKNVGLVSGFSPAILESVLAGEDFTPMGVLRRAVSKYNIITP